MSDTKDKIQGILDNDVITANRQNDLIALDIVSVVEAEKKQIFDDFKRMLLELDKRVFGTGEVPKFFYTIKNRYSKSFGVND